MRRETWRIIKALGFSIIPGLGHIYLRRSAAGIGFFYLFCTAANGVFLGSIWIGEPTAQLIYWPSLTALVATWVFSMYRVYQLTIGIDRGALRVERDQRFLESMKSYLRGDFAAAAAGLERVVQLDIDRTDADAWFHLAVARRLSGQLRGAKRALRRCEAVDPERRWRFEARIEHHRLREARRGK